MTTASEPVFDATNPHAMGDDREPIISPFERAVIQIAKEHFEGVLPNHRPDPDCRMCSFISDARTAAEALYEVRNIRIVIQQIIPLIPIDTPDPEDDFTELKNELAKLGGAWFVAPECEMPLWIGLATTLEEWLEEPKEDWPEWKRQVLAIFTGVVS